MKRRFVGVTLALLGVAAIGAGGIFTQRVEAAGAAPQAFIAELCWQVTDFPDVYRLALNSSGSGLQVNGRHTAATFYSIPVDGAGAVDVEDGSFELSLAEDDSIDGPEYGFEPGQAVFSTHMKIGAGGNGTLEISLAGELISSAGLTFLGACPAGSVAASKPALLAR